METSHCAVGALPGFLELPVPDLELFLFLLRIGESLRYPDTGDRAFHTGVNFSNRGPGIPECLAHFLAQAYRDNNQERYAGKDNQRQP